MPEVWNPMDLTSWVRLGWSGSAERNSRFSVNIFWGFIATNRLGTGPRGAECQENV